MQIRAVAITPNSTDMNHNKNSITKSNFQHVIFQPFHNKHQ